DFAIRIDRPRLPRLDLEFQASCGAHLLPCAMRAGAEGAQHGCKAPDGREFEAVEVEMAVIDLRICLDHIATAIMPAIADRDLEGLHARHPLLFPLLSYGRGEGARLQQHPGCRHGIAEASEALLEFGVQAARKIGGQADARDVEEGMAVDAAKI